MCFRLYLFKRILKTGSQSNASSNGSQQQKQRIHDASACAVPAGGTLGATETACCASTQARELCIVKQDNLEQ